MLKREVVLGGNSLMETTSNFRPEMHIAQQSRRERLRIQQQLNHPHSHSGSGSGREDVHELYANTCLQEHMSTSNEEGENIPDLVQLQRSRYNENLGYNFSSEMVSFTAHSQASNKIISCDPQNFNTWKSIGSNGNRDWATSGSASLVGHPNSTTTMIIGDLSDPLKTNNIPSYMNIHPNSYDVNQHVRFSLSAPCNEIPSRKHYHYRDDVQFICPSSINQTVTYDSGTTASFSHENPREPWAAGASAYAENVNAQGLSLSLSTMPLTKQNQCRLDEKLATSQDMIMSDHDYASNFCSKPPPNSMLKLAQKSAAPGPLGPFTGYETILKTSKYLNPAQQILHQLCSCATTPEISNISHDIIRPCGDDDDDDDDFSPVGGGAFLDGNSGGPAAADSPFGCSSNDKTQEAAASSSTNDSCRPDYLQKKEKLLYMQEEVCRRYKHYHQQMQIVVSSFESVAGLSSSTPYISVALKAISKLFHSLRNAISDHLRSVRKALGEDMSSPTTGASSSKCDATSSSMFKLIDNPYQKSKPAVNNLGLFEPQKHVWRPQRGLPERAVAILRTWLFDHFLHPYPTDSDKHMLASQTGLTRNQVSNWFINARVRIWKPMVEEIHSLETKATAETGSNIGKNDKKTAPDDGSCSNDGQQPLLNPIPKTGLSGSKQVEFPGYSASGYPMTTAQAWNQEGSIVDFVPYLNGGGMDLGGFGGAVSLTLGLRQNGQQPPQHLLQHQPASNRHCGDQIVYDFVG